jgi:hypothetical protein
MSDFFYAATATYRNFGKDLLIELRVLVRLHGQEHGLMGFTVIRGLSISVRACGYENVTLRSL